MKYVLEYNSSEDNYMTMTITYSLRYCVEYQKKIGNTIFIIISII